MKRNTRRQQSARFDSLYAETFELRQMLSATSASIDGTGNNVVDPDLGSVHVELIRLAEADYADGISDPAGEDRVSAREVSNSIAAQDESVLNDRNLTDFVWIWGQFLDHDIDLTEGATPEEAFDIEVPTGDVHFDPFGTGVAEISLNRSVYVDGEDSSDGLRQQLNEITAFIDGSVVYGSDQERADALRTFEGGLLKTSDGDFLPFNEEGLPNAGGTSDTLFLAGDIRANENVALTSMHTIFVREHNRIATELANEDPRLTDEEVYQAARATVRAQIQAITYNEFLPALFGSDALSEYAGYNSDVNPNIANEFSTAAYRFGHSLLSPELQLVDAEGNSVTIGLSSAFFRPDQVAELGIDSILRGASTQLAQELDVQVIDDVRNFLFGPPGAGGLDLASLNIQRGRDHGLADYNTTREALGLQRVTSFDQITSDPELAMALEETYGTVNNIDLWVGGLSEDHLDGTSMGETFTSIIVDQFERLRAGDRFWYENVLDGEELRAIENTSLSDIIERNTGIDGLQTNLFFQRGTEVLDVNTQRAGTDNVEVRIRNDQVEVRDRDRNRVIVERPIEEVSGVMLRGQDGVQERFVVDSDRAAVPPMLISIDGGTGPGDTLVVQGTRGDDVMVTDGTSVTMEDLDVVFENIDMLVMEGGDGDDTLDATNATGPQIVMMGGRGDDTLLGSVQADRMFGEDGRDVLIGGDGDDVMSGGQGQDRLMGMRGRDSMNGGDGNDMLMQEGDGIDRNGTRRLAAFLNESMGIRASRNTFENWGGRGRTLDVVRRRLVIHHAGWATVSLGWHGGS